MRGTDSKNMTPRYVTSAEGQQKIRDIQNRLSTSGEYEHYRKQTFGGRVRVGGVLTKDLAANGFIYIENTADDLVQCVYCDALITDWPKGVQIHEIHLQVSPRCPFVTGDPSINNVPDLLGSVLEDEASDKIMLALGIVMDDVKYPSMALETRRKDTFLTWKYLDDELQPCLYWEAGLFYDGKVLVCYTCGVELPRLPSGQDVWMHHTQRAPTCQLVLREKGDIYVESVLEEMGPYREPEREPHLPVITTRMIRPRYDTDVSQEALDMGYTKEDVEKAIINQVKYGDPDFTTVTALVSAIHRNRAETAASTDGLRPQSPRIAVPTEPELQHNQQGQPRQEPQQQQRQRQQQQQQQLLGNNPQGPVRRVINQLTCALCKEELVSMMCLPCSHLACCGPCSLMVDSCPICQMTIEEWLSVYLTRLVQQLQPGANGPRGALTLQASHQPSDIAEFYPHQLRCAVCKHLPIEAVLFSCMCLAVCMSCAAREQVCPECRDQGVVSRIHGWKVCIIPFLAQESF